MAVLREKVIVSQFSLSAYCTRYCGRESARKVVRISECLIVPCFDFDIRRLDFNLVQ